MDLLAKSDEEIFSIGKPFWENLVRSSNLKDYGGFTRDFSTQMLFGANEVELGKQWANNELITNLNAGICEIELNNKVLGKELRNENIASKASELAKEREIRNAIIKIQRNAYDPEKGLIADGRDMGTIIFPEAALKVFLQASSEVRAERRANQLKEKGMSVIMHDLFEQIQQRDEEDINRKISPLKPADDSLVIDTSYLSIKEVEERVMENLKKL